MSNFVYYLKYNKRQFLDSVITSLGFLLPDKLYLSLKYRIRMGEWINWKQPTTFTEKIQWLKIYGRKANYTTMVDKDLVKAYVSSLIGQEYIIPTIGRWNDASEINWEDLPNQFVLKTTHGGGNGGVLICKNKDLIDKNKYIETITTSLRQNIYRRYREWPYKNIRPKVIAELYMKDRDSEELADYKFFCFNGEPRYCQVIRNRRTIETIDFYDIEWHHEPFVGLNPKVHNGKDPVPKPKDLKKMIEICRKLSFGIPFVRIDLYSINGKTYFGEITFYPGSGFGRFEPSIWNKKLGQMIDLSYGE